MIVFATISVTAQKDNSRALKKEHRMTLSEFSPEELAQLKVKRLTLKLDLTEVQQQKIQAMELEKLTARKAKIEARKNKTLAEVSKKPQREEHLARINERLDRQIAEKEAMKSLLDAAQYEKWEQLEAKPPKKNRRKKVHTKKHRRK